MSQFLLIALSPLALWGLVDLYMWYRFQRSSHTDNSNLFNWPRVKWLSASHPDEIAEVYPWILSDEGDIVK